LSKLSHTEKRDLFSKLFRESEEVTFHAANVIRGGNSVKLNVNGQALAVVSLHQFDFLARTLREYDFQFPDIFVVNSDIGDVDLTIKSPRGVLHVTVGTDDWEPSIEDLENVTKLFMEANDDSHGAIVASRKGLVVDKLPEYSVVDAVAKSEYTVDAEHLVKLEVVDSKATSDKQTFLVTPLRNHRSILHLAIGSDIWDPTDEQMQRISEKFTPTVDKTFGNVVVTKSSVSILDQANLSIMRVAVTDGPLMRCPVLK